jgi:protein involved in polysaccharide export with SLBB domain
MPIRKTIIPLVLLLATFTGACTEQVRLAPIPPVQLPREVKVPVLVPLPEEMTATCAPAPVPAGGLNTDADGALQTAREKVRADCAEGKLKTIRQAQPAS